MTRPPNVSDLPGCCMGQTYRSPSAVDCRWWMVCESGEWLLVYHRTDGQWQECFDGWESKGPDRVFSTEDYTGPWRPVLDVDLKPILSFFSQLTEVQA